MRREFLLNLILLVFINVLIKPVYIFGVDLGVQNRLGEQYGVYFALLNLTYLTQIINDFGIQNFNNRHVSQHPHLLNKYFPNLLALKAVLGLAYVSLTFLIAWLLLGYHREHLSLLAVLLLNQILVQLILFLRSNISGLGHYRLDSLLSSLDKLLMLFTCGVVLWTNWIPLTLMSFAWAQTVALAATAMIVFTYLHGLAAMPVKPSWARNWRSGAPAMLYLFRESLPYALVILLMFAYTRLDAVILERVAGAAHADVYAGAFRLLEACNMFGYLFASLLLPMFARLIKKKDPVAPLASLSFRLIWAGSITVSAAIFFAREPLLHWMMPHRVSEYRFEVLAVLIWAFVPVSVTYIFSTLLTAGEKMMQMNRFFLMGIAIDLSLNLLLIPRWQALGSAIAALVTQVFIAVSMVWLSNIHYKLRYGIRSGLRVLGYAVFVLGTDILVFGVTGLNWEIKFAMALLTGLAGLLLFQMVDLKKARAVLSAGE